MLNKKYGVWGLGKSGIATIKYLIEHSIQFIVYDDQLDSSSKLIKELGVEDRFITPNNIDWIQLDYIIKSPGIPLYQPHSITELAKKNNIPIISDIELFYRLNPNATYIGITGTNGKSTTTALIGHILKKNKLKVEIGGNIGTPVMQLPNADIYVLELSSYQLASIDKARFNIAIFLNISPDHLDWHGNMDQYIEDKYKITKNQIEGDLFIYNADNKLLSDYIKKHPLPSKIISFFEQYQSNKYCVKDSYIQSPSAEMRIRIENKNLQGVHNYSNSLAALITSEHLKINSENFNKSIASFPGLKHRMQYVGTRQNLNFYNDSKATNFDSLDKALSSFPGKKIILIIGGKEKDNCDFGIFKKYKKNIDLALLIGTSSDKFAEELDKININFEKKHYLDKAFSSAIEYASNKKDSFTILFSPGCASFDQWKNFEERGDTFIKLAKEYIDANKL